MIDIHIKMAGRMKNLRIIAGISVFFVFIFMIIMFFQFQQREDISPGLDQVEYDFNEDWCVVLLDSTKISEKDVENYGKIQQTIQDALAEGEYEKVDLPYRRKNQAYDILVFKNTLQKEYAGLTLGFSSANVCVRAVLDGRVIYEHGFEEAVSGKLLENKESLLENFVDIPNVVQNGELWIELTSPYPHSLELNNVKVETRDMVVVGVVGSNIGDIVCCLLILMMAIIMFVFALIRRYTGQLNRGETFLGMLGFSAGLYYFIGTDTWSIFYNIQEAYVMQKYLVLLIPLFLALYFERNMYRAYPRRFFCLLWI